MYSKHSLNKTRIYLENPSFDIHSVDLVTDRNNTRKLLTFVNPTTSRNGLETFTVLVELAANTQAVIFCRSETKTFDIIGRHESKGFGHEFEKAFTTEQVTESTGHYRIISCKFGGLNLLVRHETDSYVNSLPSKGPMRVEDVNVVDEVSRSFGYLCYGEPYLPLSQAASLAGAKLLIKREGQTVPIQSTLEVKTRAVSMPIDADEVIPQLWVCQTPNLVRAYHMAGLLRSLR
ncbi:hypothetical protein BO82DRAFT_431011 [Aspergillus uvarum CBS 121591]|uniref:Uncharacterized protein n=1 Tax=Aspergillus uvarum CBS 121591 TaxID=1448315 RepID=A0A319CJB6_9EURO|nr:hypothetical protein BO82DRAFT_431011 [Aspergillus uvarum CBS 121591]PYH83257.1 hypothetical protein BO82DRAFT_431011 [Aspergillus uvarum CBS 121591]